MSTYVVCMCACVCVCVCGERERERERERDYIKGEREGERAGEQASERVHAKTHARSVEHAVFQYSKKSDSSALKGFKLTRAVAGLIPTVWAGGKEKAWRKPAGFQHAARNSSLPCPNKKSSKEGE